MSRQYSVTCFRAILPASVAAILWAVSATCGRAEEGSQKEYRLVLGSMVPAGILQPGSNISVHLFGAPKGAHVSDGRKEVVAENNYEPIDVTGWLLTGLSLELPNGISAPMVISLVTSEPGVTGPSGPMLHLVVDTEGQVHRLGSDGTAASRSRLENAEETKPASASAAAPEVQNSASVVEPAPFPVAPAEHETASGQVVRAPPPLQPSSSDAPVAVEPIPPKLSVAESSITPGPATTPLPAAAERAAASSRTVVTIPVEALPAPSEQAAPVATDIAKTGVLAAVEPNLPSPSPALAPSLSPNRPETFAQAPSPPMRPMELPSDASRQPTAPATPSERPPVAVQSRTEGNLVPRAEQLMKQGDISSARLLLERAMSAGDAKAAFLLAQTYDPRALRAWNVRGMRGDPDRARELYARARQSGFASAP